MTYRVKWKTGEGEEHSRDFADVDAGYDYYQWLQRSPRDMGEGLHAYDVEWEHVYP